MNPFNQIIVERAKKALKKRTEKESNNRTYFTVDLLQREVQRIRAMIKHILRGSGFMIIGVLSASFGLEGFLVPNGVLDGGVTGISLLISAVYELPLPWLLFAINVPFIIMAIFQIGLSFSLRSITAITLLSLSLSFIHFPVITNDTILVAVFGGFFLGLGIGFAVRGGAIIDGTEVLAIYLSRKIGFSVGEFILFFNVIIFSVAAYLISVEVALYSILTYLAASKTVDFVLEGFDEYIGVTIISDYNIEIQEMVLNKLRRGATIYEGHKGFKKLKNEESRTDIVFTVITRLEMARMEAEIDKIDPKAFVVMHRVKDIKGGMIKKMPLEKLKNDQ